MTSYKWRIFHEMICILLVWFSVKYCFLKYIQDFLKGEIQSESLETICILVINPVFFVWHTSLNYIVNTRTSTMSVLFYQKEIIKKKVSIIFLISSCHVSGLKMKLSEDNSIIAHFKIIDANVFTCSSLIIECIVTKN